MNTVQVKMLTTVVTAQYGTLAEGALLRTNAAFAAHLVHECGAAKYEDRSVPVVLASGEPAKQASANQQASRKSRQAAVKAAESSPPSNVGEVVQSSPNNGTAAQQTDAGSPNQQLGPWPWPTAQSMQGGDGTNPAE